MGSPHCSRVFGDDIRGGAADGLGCRRMVAVSLPLMPPNTAGGFIRLPRCPMIDFLKIYIVLMGAVLVAAYVVAEVIVTAGWYP